MSFCTFQVGLARRSDTDRKWAICSSSDTASVRHSLTGHFIHTCILQLLTSSQSKFAFCLDLGRLIECPNLRISFLEVLFADDIE